MISQNGFQNSFLRNKNQQSGFSNNRITTLYITDFSDEIMEADVWKVMIKCGKVVDVFIAKRRNKVGKRFGFVRFLDVKNTMSFLGSIKITEIKGCKMISSLARFERKGMQIGVHDNQKSVTFKKQEAIHTHSRGSYADVLCQNHMVSRNNSSPMVHSNNSPIVVRLESSPMVWEWAKSNLIGRVSSYTKLLNVEDLKNADGCSDIKFRYIGGLHVMIELESENAANEFLMKSKDVWINWFVDLFKWNKSFVVPKRLAAVKICGLPPHTWNTGAFDEIAKVFGEVVMSEECSIEAINWDTGKVIILTNENSKIEQNVKVIIDNEELSARVFEDLGESARLIPGLSHSSTEWYGSESGTEITSEDESGFGSFQDEEFDEWSPGKKTDDGDSDHAPADGNEVSGDASKIGNIQSFACHRNVSLSKDIPVGNTKSQDINMEIQNNDSVNKEVVAESGDEDNNIGSRQCGQVDINNIENGSLNQNDLDISETNLDGNLNQLGDINFCSFNKESSKLNSKSDTSGPRKSDKKKLGKVKRARFDLNKLAGSHFSNIISKSSKSGSSANSIINHRGNYSVDDSIEVQETIAIGKLVGFDMDGYENEVRKIIRESGAVGVQ